MFLPHLAFQYVLGDKDRLSRNLSDGSDLWLTACMLLYVSIIASVPYATLSPVGSFWKVAVLYTGSMLICFPCLHVFGQFLGLRSSLEGNLALSLVITSTAAIFTFGFFPIIWFIDCTTLADPNTAISTSALSRIILLFAMAMGIVQMARCLVLRGGPAGQSISFALLIALWLPLLMFITYRMARLLELL